MVPHRSSFMRPFRSTPLLIAAFALAIGAGACSAAADANSAGFPGSSGTGDATPEPEDSGGSAFTGNPGDAGPTGAITQNPICHVHSGVGGTACNPDD